MGRTCVLRRNGHGVYLSGRLLRISQRLKISRDCRIKGESCDELSVPSKQRFTRCRSLLRIERPDGFNSGRMTAFWQGLH
jgi:hypothetical protein